MKANTLPGIFKVEYVDSKDLILYPRQKLTPKSTTTALGSFVSLPLVGLASLSYTNESTPAGTIYNCVLSGILLDTDKSNKTVRQKLIDNTHAYRVSDVYGNKYLIGIDEAPFPEPVFTHVIDNLPTGLRGIEFQINWISTLPPVELVIL